MDIVAVGADDAQEHWEDPTYRVEFWTEERVGWAPLLDAYELRGCSSVQEALEWADANADGRDIRVLAQVKSHDGVGQLTITLSGEDPTDPAPARVSNFVPIAPVS